MLKVIPIDEFLVDHPDFIPGWTADEHGGMHNPKFGKVEHIVVCKEDGTPMFDQYTIEEASGVAVLPYDTKDGVIRVGLITEERFIPAKSYIAVPRGFLEEGESRLEGACRELFEETGLYDAANPTVLGNINPNTAFYKTAFPLIVVEVASLDNLGKPEGDKFAEKIYGVQAYGFSDIQRLAAAGEIECGVTKAALTEFGCFKPEFYRIRD